MSQKRPKRFAALRSYFNATSIAGAVRGVVGDRLPALWQGRMAFCSDGKILKELPQVTRKQVCVFVHGSADTELGWHGQPGDLDFGRKLLLDFGIAPLYIRYNSGLAIHDNGATLSRLMQELLLKNKAVKSASLVGHSMGGLVIHSAVFDAEARGLSWTKKVRQIILLGTPHAGAPLAKLAEKSEQLLQFIPNPVTWIASSVLGMRSRGLKDLSLGQKGVSLNDPILLPHVEYLFIAGGLQKKEHGFLNRLLGDGMVRSPSALPRRNEPENAWKKILSRFTKSPAVRIETVPGVGHLALRNHPEVYARIARLF